MTTQQNGLDAILKILRKIAQKSTGGEFIYRGEREGYDKVSSSLYRELSALGVSGMDVEVIQRSQLAEAANYTHETDDFAILTELQHFGGNTNLIDFTSDVLIALFFACDGNHSQDGRVILLNRDGEMTQYIRAPNNPVNRVLAQKSFFVRPPLGYVDPDECVIIPASLKFPILVYLRKHHGISAPTVYNDLLGFIRSRAIHREATQHITAAITHGNDSAYAAAIEDYGRALDVNPMMVGAYFGRGIAYRETGELDQAIVDFDRALELEPSNAACYLQRAIAS